MMTESTRAERIALAIGALDPGGLAELRRLRPEDAGGPTFWRLMNRWEGEPADEPEALRAWRERRCAALFSAIAKGFGLPSKPLGRALGEIGFAELRLTRLLHASDESLLNEVRTAVHYLVSQGLSADPNDIAGLLGLNSTHPERLRRRIARSFFAHELNKG